MDLSGGDDVIVHRILLQYKPHGSHEVTCKTPVALGVKVAQMAFVMQPVFDPADSACDFACDEGFAATGAFMIEQDATRSVEVVAFTVVDRDPVRLDLGDAVG